jgi:hypothetical protein
MIMDCVIRYKNMMLIAKMKFEEFTLKLVHTDLRSQTIMVPPSNILDPSLCGSHIFHEIFVNLVYGNGQEISKIWKQNILNKK